MPEFSMDCGTVKLTRWEPSQLNGKAVAFSLHGLLVPKEGAWKSGVFSVEGTTDMAVVMIVPSAPESTDTTLRIRLWQRAADRIERAEPGRPYEFTCFT